MPEVPKLEIFNLGVGDGFVEGMAQRGLGDSLSLFGEYQLPCVGNLAILGPELVEHVSESRRDPDPLIGARLVATAFDADQAIPQRSPK